MHKGGNTWSQSVPQECSTAHWDQGYKSGVCTLGHVIGESHVIMWDQNVMLGVTGVIV
jgi:hypothetical protein